MNNPPPYPSDPQPPKPPNPARLENDNITLNLVPCPPSDFFVFSILTFMCCFLPLGILALYFSFKTRESLRKGDTDMAEKFSCAALKVNIVAVVATFLFWGLLSLLLYYHELHLPCFVMNVVFTNHTCAE